MIKTFYVQTESDTNKITDIISYQHDGYKAVELETPLPARILSGCYKLENDSVIYVQDWDKDQRLDELENQTAECIIDLDFRLSNIELGL